MLRVAAAVADWGMGYLRKSRLPEALGACGFEGDIKDTLYYYVKIQEILLSLFI